MSSSELVSPPSASLYTISIDAPLISPDDEGSVRKKGLKDESRKAYSPSSSIETLSPSLSAVSTFSSGTPSPLIIGQSTRTLTLNPESFSASTTAASPVFLGTESPASEDGSFSASPQRNSNARDNQTYLKIEKACRIAFSQECLSPPLPPAELDQRALSPVSIRIAPPPAKVEMKGEKKREKKTAVLIAEDTLIVQKNLGANFRKRGIPFILVNCGKDAVDAFSKKKFTLIDSTWGRIDPNDYDFDIPACLLDEDMPTGELISLSGSQALSEIKKINPNVLAISSTASYDPNNSNAETVLKFLKESGFEEVITKKALTDRVAEIFRCSLRLT